MGRNSLVGSDAKLCTGPCHPEGVILPLVKFYMTAEGKPFSNCIDCRNYMMGRDGTQRHVSLTVAKPVMERLVRQAGTKVRAAEIAGLPKNYFSNMRGWNSVSAKSFWKMVDACKQLDDKELKRLVTRGEAEIVEAEPLGEVLRQWTVEWLKEYPAIQRSFHKTQTVFMGPQQYLAEKTEIHIRRVAAICRSEFERVPISQADKLLTATGNHMMLGNEIPVLANPTWSVENWVEYMSARGCI